jgi:hypothetical protein
LKRFLRNNGLSLTMFGLFWLCWVGQALTGHHQHLEEQRSHGEPGLSLGKYLTSGEFLETTGENWESEFLQMAAFVWLASLLRQKGSGESQSEDEKPEDPLAEKQANSPGPVHRGGLALAIYKRSLSLALLGLFFFSFAVHVFGGQRLHNEEALQHGQATLSVLQFLGSSSFWFESLQNWQSEFMSVGVLVVLSIFLRQQDSPESKRVAEPHRKTGH